MRIISVVVYSWDTGQIGVVLDDGNSLTIKMNEEESDRVRQLGSDIFFARQKSIAKEIETARPQLIDLKPEPPVDDEVPF